MKLLKVSDSCGHYLNVNKEFTLIDKIAKADLLQLVTWTLDEAEIEFDPYDETQLKNHAHQIIYKSILQKLQSLRERRKQFTDESARLYLSDYEKYRKDTTEGATS